MKNVLTSVTKYVQKSYYYNPMQYHKMYDSFELLKIINKCTQTRCDSGENERVIVNKCNNYFSNVGRLLADTINHIRHTYVRYYMK